jgi:outer membrane scaffolding protein for murein synthesis (MipA/OmpV family)
MHKILAASMSALLLMAPQVWAAEQENAGDKEAKPLWEMKFATFARYGQSYPASEDSQFNFVPVPFPIYRGPILRVGDERGKPVSTRLFQTERFKLDFDFGLNFSVDSDDVDARTGMPDLDLLLEAGPELEFKVSESLAGGELLLALQTRGAWSFDGFDSTSRGLVGSVELKYTRPMREPGSELRLRIVPSWANDDYMDFFYGVAPEFATAFRPAYVAESGYLGTRFGASIKRQLSDSLEFRTGLNMNLHSGAANEQSPLFTDDTTFSGFVAVLWRFWESEAREPPARYLFDDL